MRGTYPNMKFSGWYPPQSFGYYERTEFKSRWLSNEELIQLLRGVKIQNNKIVKTIKLLSNEDLIVILNQITGEVVTSRTLRILNLSFTNEEYFIFAEYLRRYRIKKEREEKAERLRILSMNIDTQQIVIDAATAAQQIMNQAVKDLYLNVKKRNP